MTFAQMSLAQASQTPFSKHTAFAVFAVWFAQMTFAQMSLAQASQTPFSKHTAFAVFAV